MKYEKKSLERGVISNLLNASVNKMRVGKKCGKEGVKRVNQRKRREDKRREEKRREQITCMTV